MPSKKVLKADFRRLSSLEDIWSPRETHRPSQITFFGEVIKYHQNASKCIRRPPMSFRKEEATSQHPCSIICLQVFDPHPENFTSVPLLSKNYEPYYLS